MKKPYVFYDVFDTYTGEYIAKNVDRYKLKELLGIDASQLKNYVDKNNRYGRRYIIARAGSEIQYKPSKKEIEMLNYPEELLKDWDKTRKEILLLARGDGT